MTAGNPLKKYFLKNKGNAIDKWMHYFDIYHRHFEKYRNKPVVFLEIGVYQGGSLKMWQDYLGDSAKLFAIDINPLCKQFESEKVKIFIGSQEDRQFLRYVKSQIPPVDILIDDGGHSMKQQIVTIEELFDHVNENGVYLVEDLHTSYWKYYGGGYKKPGSFIEYSKNLIDQLNAWHSKDKEFVVDDYTRTAHSMHYYDSILVIEKKKLSPPESRLIGNIVIPIEAFSTGPLNHKLNIYGLLRKFFTKIKTKLGF